MMPSGSTIGIIGGGQLGRMMIHAASRLGFCTAVFSDKEDSPAFHVANHSIRAEYDDKKALARFGELCDIVTFEFENIPHETVQHLENYTLVRPGWNSLHISQNRIREKEFLNSIGIPTARFRAVSDRSSFERAIKEMGTPCLLKTAELGYDGKGQYKIDCKSSPETIWNDFSGNAGIVEEWIPFEMEISVVAARGLDGEYKPFSPVQNIHKEGILDTTIAPAGISQELAYDACQKARLIMDELNYAGVLAVEYFVTDGDRLLVNEIAPRPHNSGHWTIDACFTSQFEQHIRAVCGLPLGNPAWHTRAMMKNLIGLEVQNWKNFLGDSQAKIHLYGKQECKPGRKMGHVTQLDPR